MKRIKVKEVKKARIKATGEIVNIIMEDVDFVGADNGYLYKYRELHFI